jgi:hypothetical protein
MRSDARRVSARGLFAHAAMKSDHGAGWPKTMRVTAESRVVPAKSPNAPRHDLDLHLSFPLHVPELLDFLRQAHKLFCDLLPWRFIGLTITGLQMTSSAVRPMRRGGGLFTTA